MEGSIWIMALKIIIFLPFTILLIYIVLKYGGSGALKIQKGKFLRVIEKTSLSKDSSIAIVSIGKKFYLMSSSSSNNEILMELDQEEVNQYIENKDVLMKDGINKLLKRGKL